MTQTDIATPRQLRAGAGARVRAITDLVTMKLGAADTDGAYSLFEVETPPGGGFPAGTRRHEDVVLHVTEGHYEVLVDGRVIAAGPGDYVLIPRGIMHGYVNSRDRTARMQMLVSPGGIHEELLEEIGDAADRQPWDVDMEKVLAVAPKYGIEFAHEDIDASHT